MKIWEYVKISASDFQKLSFDDRPSILKNYYLDTSTKYSMGSSKIFCFFLALSLTIFSGSLFVPWLKKLIFLGEISAGFKKENLVSMTRAATENDKNVTTKIIAATFENDFGSA